MSNIHLSARLKRKWPLREERPFCARGPLRPHFAVPLRAAHPESRFGCAVLLPRARWFFKERIACRIDHEMIRNLIVLSEYRDFPSQEAAMKPAPKGR